MNPTLRFLALLLLCSAHSVASPLATPAPRDADPLEAARLQILASEYELSPIPGGLSAPNRAQALRTSWKAAPPA